MEYEALTNTIASTARRQLKQAWKMIDEGIIHEAGHAALARRMGWSLQKLAVGYDGSGLTLYIPLLPLSIKLNRGRIAGTNLFTDEGDRQQVEKLVCVYMAGTVVQRLWRKAEGRRPDSYVTQMLKYGGGDAEEWMPLLKRLEAQKDKRLELQGRLRKRTRTLLSEPYTWGNVCRLVEYSRAVVSREIDFSLLEDPDQPNGGLAVDLGPEELGGITGDLDLAGVMRRRTSRLAAGG